MTAVRVLDSETRYDDPIGMYKALNNIENVLESYSFQYANLSFGPDLPIEDDDVSAWTSILDGLLSSRDMLLSVAVGNNGEMNAESGNNRIEPPGDAVNALGVGACDSENGYWTRASYSAVGPGRSPGMSSPTLWRSVEPKATSSWYPALDHHQWRYRSWERASPHLTRYDRPFAYMRSAVRR